MKNQILVTGLYIYIYIYIYVYIYIHIYIYIYICIYIYIYMNIYVQSAKILITLIFLWLRYHGLIICNGPPAQAIVNVDL